MTKFEYKRDPDGSLVLTTGPEGFQIPIRVMPGTDQAITGWGGIKYLRKEGSDELELDTEGNPQEVETPPVTETPVVVPAEEKPVVVPEVVPEVP
ncbi:MAG: hypothetical protein WCG98_10415, partial [bacterium]